MSARSKNSLSVPHLPKTRVKNQQSKSLGMRFYHGANFSLVLSILAWVLVILIEYFLSVLNITCCVSAFLPVKDLEKRKDPKSRVKVVDKGNGNKPSVPEGQLFFNLLFAGLSYFNNTGNAHIHGCGCHQRSMI